jgi:hypothetical protein
MWLSDLQDDRATWLDLYQDIPLRLGALDNEQLVASNTIIQEARSQWIQRFNIVTDFIQNESMEFLVDLGIDTLAKNWVKWSWEHAGKHIKGHNLAGVASSFVLGVTLGRLLYGLDDLHENFSLGFRVDELRRRFRDGRLELQTKTSNQSTQIYDGELCAQYQAAYMLEALSAARMYRYYADGVDATVRENLITFLNPIAWFRGKEWRAAANELRQMGIQTEQEAEDTIGHPIFIDPALKLIRTRIAQVKLTVDDVSAGFKRSGNTSYWKSLETGYAGQATWTLNEEKQIVNFARWTPDLTQAGVYRVEAYIPKIDNQLPQLLTVSAAYTVSHLGIDTEIQKNQRFAAGDWLDLGVYYFNNDSTEFVELCDETGEAKGTSAIIFDAVRWTPVEDYADLYNAEAGNFFIYDVILPGETAEIELQVKNTGIVPWQGDAFTFVPAMDNPPGAQQTLFLEQRVLPGETASWIVSVPSTGLDSIKSVHYQMYYAGQAFGKVISGQIIILPEQIKDYEVGIRKKIEEWKSRGLEQGEELMTLILEEIEKELARQAENALRGLLLKCEAPAAMIALVALVPYITRYRRSKGSTDAIEEDDNSGG